MKRTGIKNQREQKLERRLELVRTTIRELTPTELQQVQGGTGTKVSKLGGTGCEYYPETA
jgi:hypothetical protein